MLLEKCVPVTLNIMQEAEKKVRQARNAIAWLLTPEHELAKGCCN